ncbi:MAG: hypothetical protein GYB31_11365 [Bacteroidetes bacterium]|nr:hypothetical protein [Bacteroidota bacterium]
MFRQNYRFIALLGLLIFVASCTEKAPSYLKPYYYPLETLNEGMVYEYRATNEMDPPYYWYYLNLQQDGQEFLVGTYYNDQFQPGQLVREEAVESGMLLEDFYLLQPDSSGKQQQIQAEVGESNVFPFVSSGVGSVYVFSVSYSMPQDSGAITTLYRNRQYMGDTTIVFQDREYHAIQFYVRELVDIEDEGHTEHEFDGLEIYAKNIGLVYSRKNISEEFVLEYALYDRYPMTKLEARFKEFQDK